MSLVAQAVDLLLTRHRITSVRPHVQALLVALAGLLALIVFTMSALALLLFTGLWLAFSLMINAGMGTLSAGLFIGAGIVVLLCGLGWALVRAQRTVRRAFDTLIGEGTSLPGQKTLTNTVSGAVGIFTAFRQGLKRGKKAP
ncbi:hypothetical protein [Asticcacaulis sp. YBE204]|uniref:hypothetical protein n=1 Tax=Asticcacaulis sp. YBE204 TaxID=1282363 RepID=UPI0003C3B63D|nr:hypothetical protein [Asticcacaulis sp. YBE204]ESQ81275.1 hypothetical protein AEYBE204_02750 [Asticcacaulis sp. YBE204]